VPEGGRGVIPNGFPLGVIPRLYFILEVSQNQCDSETDGLHDFMQPGRMPVTTGLIIRCELLIC
jgi:hypothetical protein